MDKPPDLLAAASLLVTCITILYSIWYQDIRNAITIKSEDHKADNEKKFATLNSVLFHQAIPLTSAAILLTLIFLPVAWNIISGILDYWRQRRFSFSDYSAVEASLFFAFIFLLLLTAHALTSVFALAANRKKLNPRSSKSESR